MGDTKLEKFLPKNQHTQRKSLNFKNWVCGEMSKGTKFLLSKSFFYVENYPNTSHFLSLKNINLGEKFLLSTFLMTSNFKSLYFLK